MPPFYAPKSTVPGSCADGVAGQSFPVEIRRLFLLRFAKGFGVYYPSVKMLGWECTNIEILKEKYISGV